VSRVFVDTSAVLALLNPREESHESARGVFEKLRAREAALLTSSFVLVETYALLARRMGLDAVAAFRKDFAPLLEVVWVGSDLHERGLDVVLERRVRDLSLVDAVSFLVMRQRRIDEAFAFDRHFHDEGFSLLN
jgi:predicted nucleic acid-binding protein